MNAQFDIVTTGISKSDIEKAALPGVKVRPTEQPVWIGGSPYAEAARMSVTADRDYITLRFNVMLTEEHDVEMKKLGAFFAKKTRRGYVFDVTKVPDAARIVRKLQEKGSARMKAHATPDATPEPVKHTPITNLDVMMADYLAAVEAGAPVGMRRAMLQAMYEAAEEPLVPEPEPQPTPEPVKPARKAADDTLIPVDDVFQDDDGRWRHKTRGYFVKVANIDWGSNDPADYTPEPEPTRERALLDDMRDYSVAWQTGYDDAVADCEDDPTLTGIYDRMALAKRVGTTVTELTAMKGDDYLRGYLAGFEVARPKPQVKRGFLARMK